MRRKRKNDACLFGAACAALLCLAWYVSTYWYQFLLLQGNSMEPAYHNHQLLIIDKRAEEFTYGMVVAFWQESLEALLVKRIVALPGDRVQIVGQELYVNDIAVCGGITYAGIAGEKIFLGPGEYFVLGDNLEVSRDSRYEDVGIVKEESIVGRILQ